MFLVRTLPMSSKFQLKCYIFFFVRIKNMGDDEIVGSRSTMRMQLPLKKKTLR